MKIPESWNTLFRRTDAKYFRTSDEIVKMLASTASKNGIEFDHEEKIGNFSGIFGEYYYQYSIEPDNDTSCYVVREEILVSHDRFILVLIPTVLFALLFSSYLLGIYITDLVIQLIIGSAILIFGSSFISFLTVPSLPQELMNEAESYDTQSSFSRFHLVSTIMLAFGGFGIRESNSLLVIVGLAIGIFQILSLGE